MLLDLPAAVWATVGIATIVAVFFTHLGVSVVAWFRGGEGTLGSTWQSGCIPWVVGVVISGLIAAACVRLLGNWVVLLAPVGPLLVMVVYGWLRTNELPDSLIDVTTDGLRVRATGQPFEAWCVSMGSEYEQTGAAGGITHYRLTLHGRGRDWTNTYCRETTRLAVLQIVVNDLCVPGWFLSFATRDDGARMMSVTLAGDWSPFLVRHCMDDPFWKRLSLRHLIDGERVEIASDELVEALERLPSRRNRTIDSEVTALKLMTERAAGVLLAVLSVEDLRGELFGDDHPHLWFEDGICYEFPDLGQDRSGQVE